MILAICVFFSLIVAAIVGSAAYRSVVKQSGKGSVGGGYFFITVVGATAFVFASVLVSSASIATVLYEGTLSSDDFPYRQEIPVEDVIVNGKSMTYIALDGTSHMTSQPLLEYSDDGKLHLISAYKTDIWIPVDFCLYEFVIQVPAQDFPDELNASEVKKYVEQARVALIENKVELPDIANEEK